MHVALRLGPQGVVCALRPEEPAALAGLFGDAAGGMGGGSPLNGWWDAADCPGAGAPAASASVAGVLPS